MSQPDNSGYFYAVDIDGVLADYMGALIWWVNRNYATRYQLADFATRRVEDVLPADIAKSLKRVMYSEDFVRHIETLPYARPGVWLVREYAERLGDLQMCYLTGRHERLRGVTTEWLRQRSFPMSAPVVMVADKAEFARRYRVRVAFEDHPRWAMSMAEAGVQVALFDYPYNRAVEHPRIVRVRGWRDFIQLAFDASEHGGP